MKLDNALTQKRKKKVSCIFGKYLKMLFLTSYRGRSLQKHDRWPTEFSANATIKFQIGIVSFSLCLSCQILAHRLGRKELRL